MPARPYIGGQAVLEGVMMRAPRAVAVAVRLPDGGIVTDATPYRPITDRVGVLKLPLLRGAVVLIESLVVGMKALSWSAEQLAESEARGGVSAPPDGVSAPPDGVSAPPDGVSAPPGGVSAPPGGVSAPPGGVSAPGKGRQQLAIAATLALSIAMGLLFFVALPHLLTWGLGLLLGVRLDADQALFHLVDGVIKTVLFLGYLLAIGQMKDIQRVFGYHGAEHMSIYAWEAGEELTVENVQRWPRLHPRCGTSFLLFVIVASILVFTPTFALLPPLPIDNVVLKNFAQVGIKMPLMLPVAGLSYEAIRLSSRYYHVGVFRLFMAPGLWLQRLTTRQPDAGQIEVGIASLQAAWECHAQQGVDDLGLEGEAFRTGQAVLQPRIAEAG